MKQSNVNIVVASVVCAVFVLTSCTHPTGNGSGVGNGLSSFYSEIKFHTDSTVFDFNSDSNQFNLIRGEEAALQVNFGTAFTSAPLVFASPTSEYNDLTMSIRTTTPNFFNLYCALSSNSSSPQQSGQQVFDWLAIPSTLSFKGIESNSVQFYYNVKRGSDTTISISYSATTDSNMAILIMSTCRAKDLFVSVGEKTSLGFNLTLALSANSSQSTVQGIYSFNWLALPTQNSIASIQTGTGCVSYTIDRGSSVLFLIAFPEKFSSTPVVFFTPTCQIPDLYINIMGKNPNSFNIMLNLSGNSSAANIQGIFTFDWIALVH